MLKANLNPFFKNQRHIKYNNYYANNQSFKANTLGVFFIVLGPNKSVVR